ncbi:MAG: hemolysin family protein [candidate division NC10 bacterium]|nr:HlyC/CorC family transporter [candidate division NC10 bacterium]MCH7896150.1 HlyC/CorC family transporter [candidate division NC10 bacterium]MCZ6551604.1 hemolysin family protein [candidate division NC10 bacterium]
MDTATLFYLIGLLFLLALSAFFSASETALFSLSRLRLQRLSQTEPERGGRVLKLLERPTRTIVTILIGNELVNVTASVTMTSLVLYLWGPQMTWLAVLFMLPLILIFGELTPKTAAFAYAERVSSLVARPLTLFSLLITPLRAVIRRVVDLCLRALGVPTALGPSGISEEDFKVILDVGRQEGVVEPTEHKMIERVLAFAEVRVRQVMTSRNDIFCLDVNLTFDETIEQVKTAAFSRIPVYHETVDRIVGILHAKDLLQVKAEGSPPPTLSPLLHPPFFIPETTRIDTLLKEFQRRRQHMAIVVNEYGATAGVVTLEDLLEELVGEIIDEFDQVPPAPAASPEERLA